MGMMVGGNRGTVSEMNVVPLIDILLVLLVIFMIITPLSTGLDVVIPRESSKEPGYNPPDYLIVVQVLADGTLRINQEPVQFQDLEARLDEIFKMRASRVAFVRGENAVEFSAVAKVIDVMRSAGIASVGLLTPDLEKSL